jgi:hypothetical protein
MNWSTQRDNNNGRRGACFERSPRTLTVDRKRPPTQGVKTERGVAAALAKADRVIMPGAQYFHRLLVHRCFMRSAVR